MLTSMSRIPNPNSQYLPGWFKGPTTSVSSAFQRWALTTLYFEVTLDSVCWSRVSTQLSPGEFVETTMILNSSSYNGDITVFIEQREIGARFALDSGLAASSLESRGPEVGSRRWNYRGRVSSESLLYPLRLSNPRQNNPSTVLESRVVDNGNRQCRFWLQVLITGGCRANDGVPDKLPLVFYPEYILTRG